MSDRGPFTIARARAGSESFMESSGDGGDKSDKFDRGNDYDIRHLFKILLIAFSSVPTTIFLAWILSWSIIILYLCTFGFAIGVACLTGLSMFIYGPVLCFCGISAFGCSLVYNISRYAWETAWAVWMTVRRVLFNLLTGPSSASSDMNCITGGGGGEDSTWAPFAWWSGGDDYTSMGDGEQLGWGQLGAPSKEPDWGSQPLDQKFETRQAAPGGATGGGGGRAKYMSITGTGTGGGALAGGVSGRGARKGGARPSEEVVPPYHVR
ncbi:hypothetical protein BGX24_008497 [Mortierella sp. AD032]|nr:hypothetical protein BGX24_008497 [Mortierella sp. AD032]